jgi:hypothetical protein
MVERKRDGEWRVFGQTLLLIPTYLIFVELALSPLSAPAILGDEKVSNDVIIFILFA